MNLFALKKSIWVTPIITLLLCATLCAVVLPVIATAQSLPGSAPAAAPAAKQTGASPTACDAWWKVITSPTCWMRGIAVGSSAIIVSAAGWILEVAGLLFNACLEFTTIGFDSQIYARVQGGIESVWTAFRDIANIIIIGMFTFIALTMILGIEKFNARQMVAKILLIAVLINFSLLFTRIIIASSNYVATQFYKAAQFNAEGAQTATAGQANAYDKFSTGISGKFGQLLGVAGVFDTGDALWKVAESSDNGWTALLMGLLTALIFLAVALVFLYTAFLLIARAILFIFLLITSSLAFASYLIPGGGFGGYGWDAWWSSLLKNAAFGPLLLLFIWATLQVGAGIKATNGTLGGLLADPSKGGSINALFSYLLILGMLYVSVKVASSFAHKIGGFNYATMAAGIPLALGARFAGALGRNFIGAPFASRSARLAGDISKTKEALGGLDPTNGNYARRRAFLEERLAGLGASKRFADKIADKKFSIAHTERGAGFFKEAGVPKAIIGGGKNVTSYGEFQKKVTKEAAEQAAELTKLSKTNIDTVRKTATETLEQQKAAVQTNVVAAERGRQAEETARRAEFDKLESDMRGYQSNYDTWHRNRPPGPSRDADMNREKVKIEQTQKQINDLRAQIRKNAGLDKLEVQLRQIDKDIKDTGDAAVKTAQANTKAVGENLAAANVPWAKGGNLANSQTVQMAREAYGKKLGESQEEQKIKDVLKAYVGPSGTPPTSPTP